MKDFFHFRRDDLNQNTADLNRLVTKTLKPSYIGIKNHCKGPYEPMSIQNGMSAKGFVAVAHLTLVLNVELMA